MKYVLIFLLGLAPLAMAEDSAQKSPAFPRYASLQDGEVFVRSGPGKQYPILWEFHRKNWPVELLALYNNWYKIRDLDGEEGWVYRGLVSLKRTVVVKEGEPALMFRKAEAKKAVLKLAPGVVLVLEECGQAMCQVSHNGTDGWVEKARLEPLRAGE